MAHFVLFDEIEQRNLLDFRATSLRLEQWRTGDFSEMRTKLREVISDDDGIRIQEIPVVQRVCKDVARAYVRRPTVEFEGDGRAAQAQERKLRAIRERACFDRFMLTVDQKLVAHHAQLVTVDPAGPGAFKYRSWSPFEAHVEFEDPLEDDIARAAMVVLRTPIKLTRAGLGSDEIIFGRRIYTQGEAWLEAPGGERRGLFRPNGENPYGRIPIAAARSEEARKGWWWPELPTDLESIQIGMVVALSDIEFLARYQIPAREVLTGEGAKGAAKQITIGAKRIVVIPGEDVEYQYHAGRPALDKYLAAVEATWKIYARARYVNPNALTESSGITGDAKEVERQDLAEEQQRREIMLEDFEREIHRLTARVHNVEGSLIKLDEDLTINITYHYPEPSQNLLQTAQAAAIRFAAGLDSATELVMRQDGCTREEAEATIERRLGEFIANAKKLQDAGISQVNGAEKTGAAVVGRAGLGAAA